MLYRKIEKKLEDFYNSKDKKALLITGARQVGKTFIVREFAKKHYKNFIELNFIENKALSTFFENATNTKDLLFRISATTNKPLIPNETLIFFDEVQQCKDIITAIKFLVEDGNYSYILSGSLLGIELTNIRSIPVGYMDVLDMYPLDFEEFMIANGVSNKIIELLKNSFLNLIPIDQTIHEKILSLFNLYLVVGGMPSVVSKYISTNDLNFVSKEQKAILNLYKMDIAQYDPSHKLYLEEILNLIPSELNSKNKRFIMKNLNQNFKLSRYLNSFIWLKDAGVALPTYSASEPKTPLKMSEETNLFKLFLSDVGLLASMYMDGIQIKILNQEKSINFGSVYENFAAEELNSHGFELYYFNSKKQGEVDFLVEVDGNVTPIEIKSGKDYEKHSALSNVLKNESYDIKNAYVFNNENVRKEGKIIYLPIYMLTFLERSSSNQREMIYKLDINILK